MAIYLTREELATLIRVANGAHKFRPLDIFRHGPYRSIYYKYLVYDGQLRDRGRDVLAGKEELEIIDDDDPRQ